MEHRCEEKGFTLIELMIAIFVTMLILGAAYTVFFGSSRAATMQTQDARMQDNARMAMDVLARDFYKMGFLVDFANYPGGTAIGGLTTKLAAANSGAFPNADQVTIAGFPTGTPQDLQVLAAKGTNVLTVAAAGAFNPGDIVGIGLSDTALVTNIVGTNNLILDTTNPSGLLNLDYPGVASVGLQAVSVVRLTTVQYFIDWTDALHPTLMQQIGPAGVPQPVAEDIEDIQIAYGVDRDNNKIIDATEWIFNGVNAGPLTPADIDKIMLVRITIVARTSREDPSLRNVARNIPAIEDRAARIVTPDGYRRYLLTRTIKCKNVDKIVTL